MHNLGERETADALPQQLDDPRAESASAPLNGLDNYGAPKDCADPEVSCHSVFGVLAGAEASDSASRVMLMRPRKPESAAPPRDVIKTIRIEVSEGGSVSLRPIQEPPALEDEQASVPSISEEPEALKDEQASVPSPQGPVEYKGIGGQGARLLKPVGEADFNVTAVQYWHPYSKDEIAADAKFKDKTILVSGLMLDISEDSVPPYVVLRGANPKQLVKCSYAEQQIPEIDILNEYLVTQIAVKVLGLGNGQADGYVGLRECSVVELVNWGGADLER